MPTAKLWEWAVFGALFAGLGGFMVLTGEDWASWGLFAIPSWCGWILLLAGCGTLFPSVRMLGQFE